jgi:hypothetical protein
MRPVSLVPRILSFLSPVRSGFSNRGVSPDLKPKSVILTDFTE